MRKIIICLIMALLLAGAADARVVKGHAEKKKATTTATAKAQAKTMTSPAPQQILPPQREITEEMLRNTNAQVAEKDSNRVDNNRKYNYFYGNWTSSSGLYFTIEPGPYFIIQGMRFEGEWTSDGRLHVDFGDRGEMTLKYSNGYIIDRYGRMYWREP